MWKTSALHSQVVFWRCCQIQDWHEEGGERVEQTYSTHSFYKQRDRYPTYCRFECTNSLNIYTIWSFIDHRICTITGCSIPAVSEIRRENANEPKGRYGWFLHHSAYRLGYKTLQFWGSFLKSQSISQNTNHSLYEQVYAAAKLALKHYIVVNCGGIFTAKQEDGGKVFFDIVNKVHKEHSQNM